ncbi:putative ABC transporter ATP-binding protein [Actinoplanes missouriensis 431]|uniref:Putative ABC transporter ATP-binding protein n=1 Tax=Actinoplanes missouriensis (strain ATCC 14538 / DSM 43046 / CBS 188.64 / JCM 3121 / NBRC 102363 / NCIMB 12654 / NRRL B-3342 / UNCC 431) TaxID=512565 RepID=I0HJJ3_ACTM4|nr:ABC transporter ATP-binding protein [Actinoplanes missouriensis]BAL93180.1 putative ABC transporter ATP-binding protein [Actinoplanes missouriensis 431]
MTTTVQAEGLRVRTGRHLAVDGVDLSLSAGVHGLLGPNGAGKTTLIRALATVLRPYDGRLRLLGQPMDARPDLREVRRALGYLPQEFGYYPRFTVSEFVEYMAWLKEVPGPRRRRAVRHALDRVGLADRAGSRMKALSGGMLRRAGIAQAIVNEPRLLLLDEPTVGLDPKQRLDFRALLRELGERSCVIVSTHLVEDVAAACSSVVLADAGRIVFHGVPDDVAAAGGPADAGDSPIERGYSALLERHRAASAVAR